MPKKSGLVTKQEAAICLRVKRVRSELQLSQPEFAAALGITRNKLACIETFITPLRYGVARVLCDEFDISQAWLAEGLGLPQPRINFAADAAQSVPDSTLLSEAFSLYLRPLLPTAAVQTLKVSEQSGARIRLIVSRDTEGKKRWGWNISQEVRVAMEDLPEGERAEFAQTVIKAMDDFHSARGLRRKIAGFVRPKDWPKNKPVPLDWAALRASGAKAPTKDVGKVHESVNDAEVKPQWPLLKKKLQRETSSAGAKSALADFLGVKIGSVSQWLSESKSQRQPGAEITLRMIKWLEDPDRAG